MSFRDTDLWQRFTINRDEAARLISSYEDFREKSGQLAGLIQGTLSDLTVHDATHLDGLWSTTSLLIGESFSINPLEIFVFGGAVLLHDSALCSEAFDGIEKIRATTIWKDAYALGTERGGFDQVELKKICDFQAIRTLHAQQARTLATRSWKTGAGESVSLISDDTLRNSYGDIIGLIASSHHWNLEQLPNRPLAKAPTDRISTVWNTSS